MLEWQKSSIRVLMMWRIHPFRLGVLRLFLSCIIAKITSAYLGKVRKITSRCPDNASSGSGTLPLWKLTHFFDMPHKNKLIQDTTLPWWDLVQFALVTTRGRPVTWTTVQTLERRALDRQAHYPFKVSSQDRTPRWAAKRSARTPVPRMAICAKLKVLGRRRTYDNVTVCRTEC